jgi:hypothetical protein
VELTLGTLLEGNEKFQKDVIAPYFRSVADFYVTQPQRLDCLGFARTAQAISHEIGNVLAVLPKEDLDARYTVRTGGPSSELLLLDIGRFIKDLNELPQGLTPKGVSGESNILISVYISYGPYGWKELLLNQDLTPSGRKGIESIQKIAKDFASEFSKFERETKILG